MFHEVGALDNKMTSGERIAGIQIIVKHEKANAKKRAQQGNEKSMASNKKSDEVLTASAFRVKALLIGSNFCRNSVSNIAERSGSCIHYAGWNGVEVR